MQFKGSRHSVSEVAQQLRVEYVLEGSVVAVVERCASPPN